MGIVWTILVGLVVGAVVVAIMHFIPRKRAAH